MTTAAAVIFATGLRRASARPGPAPAARADSRRRLRAGFPRIGCVTGAKDARIRIRCGGNGPEGELLVGDRLDQRLVVGHEHQPGPRVAQVGEQLGQRGPGQRVLAEGRLVGTPPRRGAVAIAVATDSRRFSPPESVNGLAAASAGEAEPVQQLVGARAAAAASDPARRGPTSSSSRTVAVTNWCSGSWNTVPDRGHQLARRASATAAARRRGGSSAGRGRHRRRRSGAAARPATAPASTCRRRWARSPPPPRRRAASGRSAGSASRRSPPGSGRRTPRRRRPAAVAGRGGGAPAYDGVPARHPHAARRERGAVPAEDLVRRARRRRRRRRARARRPGRPGRRPASTRCSTSTPSRRSCPGRRASTGADERGAVPGRGWRSPRRAAADRAAARGSRPGPAAAARRRRGRRSAASRPYGKPTAASASSTRAPDLGGRDAAVLQPERDVVAGPGHHERGLGVLHHQPGPRARRPAGPPVEPDRALLARRRRTGRAARPARPAGCSCRPRTGRAAGPARRARAGGRPRAAPRPGGRRAASPSRGRRGRPARAVPAAGRDRSDAGLVAAGGERREHAGAGQRPHQQPEPSPGDDRAAEPSSRTV